MSKKIRNDIILAVVVIAIAAVGMILVNSFKTEGSFVVVKINGVETESYPLTEDAEVVITTGDNDEFENVLVIEDEKAFVKEANCPDKICQGHKAISFKGETIVCLPHKVVIEIIADDSSEGLDAAV